eukprot:gene10025-26826_t
MLLIFKVIALDGWTDDLRAAQDVSGHPAYLFFLALTMLGAFFTMNLFLAILASVFSNEAEQRRDEAKKAMAKGACETWLYRVTPASMCAWPLRCAIAVATSNGDVVEDFAAFISEYRDEA